MCYKYLSLGSSDALSRQKGREGAYMVDLPLREGLFVVQGGRPRAYPSVSVFS